MSKAYVIFIGFPSDAFSRSGTIFKQLVESFSSHLKNFKCEWEVQDTDYSDVYCKRGLIVPNINSSVNKYREKCIKLHDGLDYIIVLNKAISCLSSSYSFTNNSISSSAENALYLLETYWRNNNYSSFYQNSDGCGEFKSNKVVKLAFKMGVFILFNDMKDPNGILIQKNNDKAIFVNKELNIQEKVLVIAHELAHILLNHKSRYGDNGCEYYNSGNLCADIHESQEREANILALLICVMFNSMVHISNSLCRESNNLFVEKTRNRHKENTRQLHATSDVHM